VAGASMRGVLGVRRTTRVGWGLTDEVRRRWGGSAVEFYGGRGGEEGREVRWGPIWQFIVGGRLSPKEDGGGAISMNSESK
jgi:hypothetical protein